MSDELPSYHERLEELSGALAERGALGVLAIDATRLGEIEFEYGTAAFEEVRQRLMRTLLEQRGKDFRSTDVMALEAPRSLRFLLFLDLFVFHRKAHAVGLREAAIFSAFWIALGIAFGVLVLAWLGGEKALEYYTGYLIEKSLSIDNVFIFALILGSFACRPSTSTACCSGASWARS